MPKTPSPMKFLTQLRRVLIKMKWTGYVSGMGREGGGGQHNKHCRCAFSLNKVVKTGTHHVYISHTETTFLASCSYLVHFMLKEKGESRQRPRKRKRSTSPSSLSQSSRGTSTAQSTSTPSTSRSSSRSRSRSRSRSGSRSRSRRRRSQVPQLREVYSKKTKWVTLRVPQEQWYSYYRKRYVNIAVTN